MTVDCTIEAVFNWLRPPAEVFRSRVRLWSEMPRPSAHLILSALPGRLRSMFESEAPKSSTALVGSLNSELGMVCIAVTSRRPDGVKAIMPVLI
ncbi:hypothetical protein D3C71_1767280 [compost metagenome]